MGEFESHNGFSCAYLILFAVESENLEASLEA